MAVSKYKTKKGIRWRADVYKDGARTAQRGAFLSKLEALQWEKDILRQTSEQQPRDLALFEAITLYILDVEVRRKKNTIIYKKGVLKKFASFLGKDVRFREVDRSAVKEFLNCYAKEVSPKSANKYRIELSAFWAWANIEGYAQGNPARQVETYSVTKHVRYVPPQSHISKVLSCSEGFEHDFILTLLHTAARISELRELTWEDVDLERGTIRLWTSKRRGGDKESRILAISPTLYAILTRLYEQRVGSDVHVFINPLTGDGYERQSHAIKFLFQRLCKKAEVPLFTAHSLRHFIATHFNDPRRAQKILGHMNLKTTEIYLHDLGVDIGAADIFESITHKITHETDHDQEKGVTAIQ